MPVVLKNESGIEYSPLINDPKSGLLRPYFANEAEGITYSLNHRKSVCLTHDETAGVFNDFHNAIAPVVDAPQKARQMALADLQDLVLK